MGLFFPSSLTLEKPTLLYYKQEAQYSAAVYSERDFGDMCACHLPVNIVLTTERDEFSYVESDV